MVNHRYNSSLDVFFKAVKHIQKGKDPMEINEARGQPKGTLNGSRHGRP